MARLPRGFQACTTCGVVTEVVDERGWCLPCQLDEVMLLADQLVARLAKADEVAKSVFLKRLTAALTEGAPSPPPPGQRLTSGPGGYLVSTPRDMPRGIFTEPLDEGPHSEPEVPC